MNSLLSSGKDKEPEEVTVDNVETVLKDDTKIKLAGIDVDGVYRNA